MYRLSVSTILKQAISGVCIILNSLRQAELTINWKEMQNELTEGFVHLRKKEREETGIVMFYSTKWVFSLTTVYKLTIEFLFCINIIAFMNIFMA